MDNPNILLTSNSQNITNINPNNDTKFSQITTIMTQRQLTICPTSLTKLGAGDAARLYEYIMALEKENTSRNEERIFMEKFMDEMKTEIQWLTADNQRWKDKEVFFNAEIYRLSHENMRIGGELRHAEDVIKELQQQMQRMSIQYRQNELHLNQLLQQRQQQIQKQREINKQSVQNCTKIQSLTNLNISLSSNLSQKQATLKQVEKKMKEMELENARLMEELDLLKVDRENIQKASLEQVEISRAELGKVKQDCLKIEGEVQDIRGQLSNELEKNKKLTEQCRANVQTTQQLKNENISLTSKLSEMQKMQEQTETKHRQLQGENLKLKLLKQQHEIKQQLRLEQAAKKQKEFTESADLNENIRKQVEELRGQLQNEENINRGLRQQLKDLEDKNQKQAEAWASKHKQIQQFVEYIKTHINQLQSTIQTQNNQIQALTATSEKLKQQILEPIAKMSSQMQQRKQKQLEDAKVQLASCKGKLAEKEKKLQISLSQKFLTALELDLNRLRGGADTTEEDRQSQNVEERDNNIQVLQPSCADILNSGRRKKSGLIKSNTMVD